MTGARKVWLAHCFTIIVNPWDCCYQLEKTVQVEIKLAALDELDTRAFNSLRRFLREGRYDGRFKGAVHFHELNGVTVEDLLMTRNMGPVALRQVLALLRNHGVEVHE